MVALGMKTALTNDRAAMVARTAWRR